jgi:hypothetical protein
MFKIICLTGAAICIFLLRPDYHDFSIFHGTEDSLQKVRIVFYNVENLFHPTDDSLTNDEEFTPLGAYHWTYNRYFQKLKKIAQVFISLSDQGKPAVIGLCEIENRRVLHDLINLPGFKKMGYRIIHQESDDPRGIDVAFLYDPVIFSPESYSSIQILNKDGTRLLTRNILRVKGIFFGKYTCHFFVNHWPSRRGGQKSSEKRRMLVAGHLRREVEKIVEEETDPNIIIMGDFNDEPADRSLREVLQAVDYAERENDCNLLYNLMFGPYRSGYGTHYRKNNFIESSLLDQFIVSKGVIEGFKGLKAVGEAGNIYRNGFLIDEKNSMPLRTFQGYKYLGGTSDHFPVFIDLYTNYALK